MTQDLTEIQKNILPNRPTILKKVTVSTRIRKSITSIGQLAAIALSAQALALDLYVSPAGNDTNPGTEAAPIASLSAVRDAARKVVGKEAVTIHVGDGIYHLPETLVFTPADSGSPEFPVVYRAVNEGRAVLSGGSELKLDWKPYRDGIFQAVTPQGLEIDQLFINGKAQRMARYPNFDASKKPTPTRATRRMRFPRNALQSGRIRPAGISMPCTPPAGAATTTA